MPTHYHGPADEVRALNAYIPLVRATESVLAALDAQLEAEGLTLSQFGALEALLHLGPMCQRELGDKLLRSRGNVTLVVDNLEKHGWVRRDRSSKDRRIITLHLTHRGRTLISRLFPAHATAILDLMRRLTVPEQEELRRLCRKLGKGAQMKNSTQKSKQSKGDKHDYHPSSR